MSQHKKLVEGTLYEEVTSASYSENDISNSLRNGILYLEDPIDHVSVCVWVCGGVGVWVCGCVGVWVCGWVC